MTLFLFYQCRVDLVTMEMTWYPTILTVHWCVRVSVSEVCVCVSESEVCVWQEVPLIKLYIVRLTLKDLRDRSPAVSRCEGGSREGNREDEVGQS